MLSISKFRKRAPRGSSTSEGQAPPPFESAAGRKAHAILIFRIVLVWNPGKNKFPLCVWRWWLTPAGSSTAKTCLLRALICPRERAPPSVLRSKDRWLTFFPVMPRVRSELKYPLQSTVD
ncbi:hypothetical protein AVEN_221467-1 [Araneus ventricosus]|uniref:Uncharacterized protein n=1 Tax=Araneus ventricosus TaxID=182803 RepID=A0A4Y2T7Z7_ARAVE|nr:hypothetical protein AVEN_221467-1 [Araneus ventricosus]